jgi:hypothetical protein
MKLTVRPGLKYVCAATWLIRNAMEALARKQRTDPRNSAARRAERRLAAAIRWQQFVETPEYAKWPSAARAS